jgi:hypothetical protein
VPLVVDDPLELISANARIARIGVFASASVVPVGWVGVQLIGSWTALILAAAVFGWSAVAAHRVPRPPPQHLPEPARDRMAPRRRLLPRSVRLARLATAGVRFLNGFLLLLVAFAFRDQNAGVLDFGALLGAAGVGFLISAFISPFLEKRLREEPMVVAALAVEAAAGFIAAQAFGLPAAAALAAAAGFAWGTAKFGYDGLLQATVHPDARGWAFTSSETLYQLVWVFGSIIPVVIDVPIDWGLAIAGVLALTMQVIYISALIVPMALARGREGEARERAAAERDRQPDLGDLL